MGSKMLIDANHAEETRVVVVRGTRIEEFDFESAARRQLKGNIYLAKVTRVEPSLQAAFIEYGGNRHGFLAFSEIHPDYYQIPLADRQALLREQEEDEAAEREDEDREDDSRASRGRRHGRDNGNGGAAEGSVSSNDGLEAAESEESDDNDGAAGEDIEPAAMALERHDEEVLRSEPVAGDRPTETGDTVEEAAPAPHPAHGVPADLGNGVETVEEDSEGQKVESVGAEDALEEVPRRQRRAPRRHYKIQEVIKRRQVILVQVVACVGENHVRYGARFQRLEPLLDRHVLGGEETVPELHHLDLCAGCSAQEVSSRRSSLGLARTAAAPSPCARDGARGDPSRRQRLFQAIASSRAASGIGASARSTASPPTRPARRPRSSPATRARACVPMER